MFGVIIKKTELSEMFPGMKTAEINEGHKVPGYSKFSINVSLNYVFFYLTQVYTEPAQGSQGQSWWVLIRRVLLFY